MPGFEVDDTVPERVLAFAAHPDDVDFGMAGTAARWVVGGADVVYCIVTNGDAGGFDPAIPREDIPGIRQREQVAAAAAVGVTDVRFLGYPDGRVTPSIELRRDISRVIRQVRPTRVVCQSPERIWSRLPASHPDHIATGEAVVAAVFPDAGNPFAHTELLQHEGLEAWSVAELWLTASPSPDVAVDITDTVDRKVAALLNHASQHQDQSWIDPRMREWGAGNAALAGMPEGRLAELFQRVGL